MPRRRKPAPALALAPVYVSDAELTQIAGRFREESVAVLLAVARDPKAPAMARATLPPAIIA